jgi:hypothetical protein
VNGQETPDHREAARPGTDSANEGLVLGDGNLEDGAVGEAVAELAHAVRGAQA